MADEPKEIWWKVTNFDVGRELANPDWAEWARKKLTALTTELSEKDKRIEGLEGINLKLVNGIIKATDMLSEKPEKLYEFLKNLIVSCPAP